jgi:hypothetical protein
MLGERIEHVIEKFDIGIDLDRSAVKRKTQIDLRLFRGAFDGRMTADQLSAPLTA